MNEQTIAKFWGRVKRGAPDECWEWQGTRNADGYGCFYINSTTIGAHRIAYAIANDGIPEGMHVLHHCDNPPCCNPQHLWIGTNRDNIADRCKKGRSFNGEKGWVPRPDKRKLTEQDVRTIRSRYVPGVYGAKRLANEFGVAASVIQKILSGRTWRDVK